MTTWEEQDQYRRSVEALEALWRQVATQSATNITKWGGQDTTLGAKPGAQSIPVVLATDQAPVPVDIGSSSITLGGTVAATQSGPWSVSVIQPVAVDVNTSVLPTGAATEATLSALNTKVTACNTGAVTIAALPNEGQQTMANSISVAIASDQSSLPVSVSIPGVATEATLAALNTKIPVQGQAAMAASIPVVIASNQSSIPVNLALGGIQTGTINGNGQTIELALDGDSGAVIETNGTAVSGIAVAFEGRPRGSANWIELRGFNIRTNLLEGTVALGSNLRMWTFDVLGMEAIRIRSYTYGSGSVAVRLVAFKNGIGIIGATVTGTVAATQSGTWNITNISGTVSLPTGAATEATLAALNAKVTACNTGAVTIAALPNEGQQTMANSISVAIASDQSTVPVSLGAVPLPTGAATEATLAALNAKVTACNTGAVTIAALPNEGQQTMANSISVAIASDQSALPISAASLPLPSGAATEATLSALNAKVTACNTGAVTIAALPNEGQQTMANSISVAIASDQSTLPVSVASVPLPTGAATEATLSAINTKTPALGQATMANSSPVVIASDQSTLPVAVVAGSTTTGNITANGQSITLNINNESGVVVETVGTGVSGISIAFEGQPVGSAQWVGLQAYDIRSNLIEGTVALTSNTRMWSIDTLGLAAVRVRSFAWTAGSATVRIVGFRNGIGIIGARVVGTVAATQSGTWNVGTVTTVSTVTNITNQGQLVDNAAFVDGTTRLNMSGYIFDEVAGTALTENDAAASRIDSKRAQIMVIEDSTTRGRRVAVNASNEMLVAASTAPFKTIAHGSRTFPTAGSPLALAASSTPMVRVDITANAGNTGTIWIGGTGVAAGSGRPLVAGQMYSVSVGDLAAVFGVSTVNGEGVSFAYYT